MLIRLPGLLTPEEVATCRRRLEASPWVDGRLTAGDQAAGVKHNLQIPADSPEARELGEMVLQALGRSPGFNAAALPLRVLPPMFNRYDPGMTFGPHVDNAIRTVPGTGGMRLRADLSSTIFLTPPDAYEGGELVVQDLYGQHAVKLAAGDMVLYPASSLHHVEPVRRGSRWGVFFWTQSLIKEDALRSALYELDLAIMEARAAMGDRHAAVLRLVNHYHNLVRRWAEL